ncbi:MAG: hypothetical protein V3S16_05925 [Candidatus Desulfatibia sp.]|uniref:tetratricopeptide repeat protein n=1 Tax=Candidatus Desulfatibia sp. TaxID=3101189 RepID=UPI002F2EF72A
MSKERTQTIKSAENGDPAAQFNVGMMYYYGSGLELNADKGVEWMRKAASKGNFDAKFFLKAISIKH